MIEGIAGGIEPWWHYVGASHEDRRIYRTAGPLFNWHKANQEYLTNREPVATAGILWSQQNTDFYGRDETENLVDLPFRGIRQALIRSRIPFIPVNADHIARDAGRLSLLIVPNVGIITPVQAAAIKQFVENGGGLIVTGESGLYDEWGNRNSDFALAELTGVHVSDLSKAGQDSPLRKRSGDALHTYLRLLPAIGGRADGPKNGTEKTITGERHEILLGFEETDILPYGGLLEQLKCDSGSKAIMTFIPQFPIYPPETAWMREPETDIPGLIISEKTGMGKVACLPADIDRQYSRYNLPDHGNLLTNIFRWAIAGKNQFGVKGTGLIDCNIYKQKDRLIIHFVNLTSAGTWRQPVDEFIPVGPFEVQVKLPEKNSGTKISLLVSGQKTTVSPENGWLSFKINSISDHEVAVIE
jgi:hypothetical protein